MSTEKGRRGGEGAEKGQFNPAAMEAAANVRERSKALDSWAGQDAAASAHGLSGWSIWRAGADSGPTGLRGRFRAFRVVDGPQDRLRADDVGSPRGRG